MKYLYSNNEINEKLTTYYQTWCFRKLLLKVSPCYIYIRLKIVKLSIKIFKATIKPPTKQVKQYICAMVMIGATSLIVMLCARTELAVFQQMPNTLA